MVKKTILDIDRCTIRYRDRRDAVSQLSLSVRQGEIVSIVGESRSGQKSGDHQNRKKQADQFC